MRISRALAATVLAWAAIGLTAPVAAADTDSDADDDAGPRNITAMPRQIARGGSLSITVDGPNCNNGKVSSSAFARDVLLSSTNMPNRFHATATIRNNARLGSHTFTVACSQGSGTGTFTVIGAGAAQGGLGGLMRPTAAEMAIGGSMVAVAAIGGCVYLMRRRVSGGKA
jgi:hypothetical protein